jgi:AraC-like DNA-binding protein
MLLQPDEIKVSSMDREFIKELKAAIQKNMSDPEFGVEPLSRLIYMDRSTVFRKIKALTGETPQLFIRSFRLQRGAELLKKQFGTVSQVASEVGFDNVAYFAKCFREKYNVNPSSFVAAESGQKK